MRTSDGLKKPVSTRSYFKLQHWRESRLAAAQRLYGPMRAEPSSQCSGILVSCMADGRGCNIDVLDTILEPNNDVHLLYAPFSFGLKPAGVGKWCAVLSERWSYCIILDHTRLVITVKESGIDLVKCKMMNWLACTMIAPFNVSTLPPRRLTIDRVLVDSTVRQLLSDQTLHLAVLAKALSDIPRPTKAEHVAIAYLCPEAFQRW